MDPETALVLFGSAGLALKVLGPTADYLGEGMKDWSHRRVENVKQIFEKASEMIGEDDVDPNISVPPRVLAGVINEGSFCDDELALQYFGGVLASSRSGVPRDDRGTYWNGIVARLSTYQLRCHYVLYAAAQPVLRGKEINLGLQTDAQAKAEVFIPWQVFLPGMDFTEDELPNFQAVVSHALWGIYQLGLIYTFSFGPAEGMGLANRGVSGGVKCVPSALGAELFLWAHGRGEHPVASFTAADSEFDVPSEVTLASGTCLVNEMEPKEQ